MTLRYVPVARGVDAKGRFVQFYDRKRDRRFELHGVHARVFCWAENRWAKRANERAEHDA